VDMQLGRVLDKVAALGGLALVTADHGNAEQMLDPMTGAPHTAHTTNPVPFVVVPPNADSPWQHAVLRDDGVLSDIGPTVLEAMGLPHPAKMQSRSLLRHETPAVPAGELSYTV
jgi:2,3-bisphosphoglycerate-independent phosphoglycerate mutase